MDWTQDELIEYCFLAILKNPDLRLPITGTDLSQSMRNERPEGTTLEIKKSSYKTLTKFLQAMKKEKLIEFTDTKKGLVIQKISREHEKLKNFDYVIEAKKKDPPKESSLVRVYKPSHYLKEFLDYFEIDVNHVNSYDFWKEKLHSYVIENQLYEKEFSFECTVNLDKTLIDGIYHQGGDRREIPKSVEFSQLREDYFHRLYPHTKLTMRGRDYLFRNEIRKIKIIKTKKRGRLHTEIYKVESYGIDIDEISRDLMKKLGCTTEVKELISKHDRERYIYLHGDLVKRAQQYFLDEGFLPEIIET